MLLFCANALLAVSGVPLLTFVWTARRAGPEGPVGAHMVTTPLALLFAVGAGLSTALVPWPAVPIPAWPAYASLPGVVIALTVLPILALERRWRTPARLGVTAAVAGAFVAANGAAFALPAWLQAAGLLPTVLLALVGYGMLAALWLQLERSRVRSAAAAVERQSEFERSQAEWQRGEWAKLPAEPGLWQLIQFAHAFDADVKAQCLARIQAMPELERHMQELLGTGWAEHALSYLEKHYPLRFAPLASSFAAFATAHAEHWRPTLARDQNHGSWFYNLVHVLAVAERIAADGGDVRAAMAAWAQLLDGKRGLQELARRAAKLAT